MQVILYTVQILKGGGRGVEVTLAGFPAKYLLSIFCKVTLKEFCALWVLKRKNERKTEKVGKQNTTFVGHSTAEFQLTIKPKKKKKKKKILTPTFVDS